MRAKYRQLMGNCTRNVAPSSDAVVTSTRPPRHCTMLSALARPKRGPLFFCEKYGSISIHHIHIQHHFQQQTNVLVKLQYGLKTGVAGKQ